MRVFRGSTPDQGPFTKDLSYSSKGLILIYNYIRFIVRSGDLTRLTLLFTGKINLQNIHLLSEIAQEDY